MRRGRDRCCRNLKPTPLPAVWICTVYSFVKCSFIHFSLWFYLLTNSITMSFFSNESHQDSFFPSPLPRPPLSPRGLSGPTEQGGGVPLGTHWVRSKVFFFLEKMTYHFWPLHLGLPDPPEGKTLPTGRGVGFHPTLGGHQPNPSWIWDIYGDN